MPKLIVLFYGGENAPASLAESAADGAKGVRFTEVDIRAGERGEGKHKAIESLAELRDYDGVLLVSGSEEAAPEGMIAALSEAGRGDAYPNSVFGLVGGGAAALASIAKLGGIIVAEPRAANADERARKLGARMAKVVGWVRHALGHEAEHHHHH